MRCTFTACSRRASLVWLPMADHAVAICWLHRVPATIATMRRLLA